jgi:hypothetical protein
MATGTELCPDSSILDRGLARPGLASASLHRALPILDPEFN